MCQACAAASIKPLTSGLYFANCKGCSARMLAHGQEFWRSAKSEELKPTYRALLVDTFGREGWTQGHADVKRWAKIIDDARRELMDEVAT